MASLGRLSRVISNLKPLLKHNAILNHRNTGIISTVRNSSYFPIDDNLFGLSDEQKQVKDYAFFQIISLTRITPHATTSYHLDYQSGKSVCHYHFLLFRQIIEVKTSTRTTSLYHPKKELNICLCLRLELN